MKFVLHALRHVTGVWGGKTSWGGEFLKRREGIRAERKRYKENGGILNIKGGVNLRKRRQTERPERGRTR